MCINFSLKLFNEKFWKFEINGYICDSIAKCKKAFLQMLRQTHQSICYTLAFPIRVKRKYQSVR